MPNKQGELRSTRDKGGAPDFSVPRWVVEEAYEKVLSGVDAPGSVKSDYFAPYLEANWSGDPRLAEATALSFWGGIEWAWPEFARWEQVFCQDTQYPVMWNVMLRIPQRPAPPSDMPAALRLCRVQDLRAILKQAGLSSSEKKREELAQVVAEHVPLEVVKSVVGARHAELIATWERGWRDGKCRLLLHTLDATASSLLNWHKGHELLRDGISSGWKWQLWELGDPVESMWARKLYAPEEGALPPFFPGDRTRHSLSRS
jgi:hypothetical protein